MPTWAGVTEIRLRLINVASGEQIWNETALLKGTSARVRPVALIADDDGASSESFVRSGDATRHSRWRAGYNADGLCASCSGARSDVQIAGTSPQAEALYEEALRRDPDFVPALLRDPRVLDGQIDFDANVDRERMVRRMDEVTTRAVNLNRTAPETWNFRSQALMYLGRWDAALKQTPGRSNSIRVRHGLSVPGVGHVDGRKTCRGPHACRAGDCDGPSASGRAMRVACGAYLLLGQYDEAVAACDKASGLSYDEFDICHLSRGCIRPYGCHQEGRGGESQDLARISRFYDRNAASQAVFDKSRVPAPSRSALVLGSAQSRDTGQVGAKRSLSMLNSEHSVSRRLAAIVVADVVGYSRLMERDEAGTHARLKEIRAQVVDPRIAAHGGRIINTSGDGMLVEFTSATRGTALRDRDPARDGDAQSVYVVPEDRIEFRIGINLGDIIIDGDDIAGEGVNVAARLETLAEPGGICIAAARSGARAHEDSGVSFVDLGEQQVKNIVRADPGLSRDSRIKCRVEFDLGARLGAIRVPRRQRLFYVISAAVVVLVIGAATFMRTGIPTFERRPDAALTVKGAQPPAMSVAVLPFGTLKHRGRRRPAGRDREQRSGGRYRQERAQRQGRLRRSRLGLQGEDCRYPVGGPGAQRTLSGRGRYTPRRRQNRREHSAGGNHRCNPSLERSPAWNCRSKGVVDDEKALVSSLTLRLSDDIQTGRAAACDRGGWITGRQRHGFCPSGRCTSDQRLCRSGKEPRGEKNCMRQHCAWILA